MAKFKATATVMISLFKRIDAETQEEADKIASGLNVSGLYWQCSEAGKNEPNEWELDGIDGIDGEPGDIESLARRDAVERAVLDREATEHNCERSETLTEALARIAATKGARSDG